MTGAASSMHAVAGLTTHVLDIMRGIPAAGVRIDCYLLEGGERRLRRRAITNAQGRVQGAVLTPPELRPGQYVLVFHVGAYFRTTGVILPEPPFLDEVEVRFGIADASARYHVPLLISPFGYTIYRGS